MAVPFSGKQMTLFQPDGTEVEARGWGNQFEAVFETLGGYTIVSHPQTGFLHYATLSEDKTTLLAAGPRVGSVDEGTLNMPRHLRTTGDAAVDRALAAGAALGPPPRWQERRRERRAAAVADAAGPAAAPPQPTAVGDIVGLCLLIQFPDVAGTISQAEVTNFCNQVGYSGFGNNGSVYDYFLAVSDGKLRYRNLVTAYYTAQHNRSYYTDPTISYGMRAQELAREALSSLAGVDVNQLSADSAGNVYALNIFYAGPRVNNWAQGLWPHQSSLFPTFAAAPGKQFRDYQITDMASQLTLGTFCHENGHMVCDFPDLYDYGSQSNGVGDYCLMCNGGAETNPTEVSAYLKYEAGWTTKLTTLTPGATVSVAAGSNDFVLYPRTANEYFIIENRQQAQRDATLPDSGLLIWHVDEFGTNSNEQMTPTAHYELSLEQADGRFDLEHRANLGDSSDLFGGPAARRFGIATAPNSRWWDGTPSGLEIVDVSAPGATMTITTAAAAITTLSNATVLPIVELGRGDIGADVETVQRFLAAFRAVHLRLGTGGTLPADPGPIDGDYGPQTETAVVGFQQRFNLIADGIWGPNTAAKARQAAAVTSPLPSSVVAIGASGPTVTAIQRFLAARAAVGIRLFPSTGEATVNPGAIDGSFGPTTRTALRNWQAFVGTTADGMWGPTTASTSTPYRFLAAP